MATLWWYGSDGQPVGYLGDDERWFFKTTGETIGYREGDWIYTPQGQPLAYFGGHEGKWIYDKDGQPLGYLSS